MVFYSTISKNRLNDKMNNNLFSAGLLLISCMSLMTQISHAGDFLIRKGSNLYDAKIDVTCQKDACSGVGNIILYQKNTQKMIQQFKSDELNFYLDETLKPTVNIIELYGEQSPLIFDDFNFDGSEDIAIRNGSGGPYGGPTYDVYVFHRNKKKFVLSQDLTNLTYESLGMFQNDPQHKRIITLNKSGCCYHIRSEYSVVLRKGLLLVRDFEEDVTVGGDKVRVTERNLIRGKWKISTQYFPVDQYYK